MGFGLICESLMGLLGVLGKLEFGVGWEVGEGDWFKICGGGLRACFENLGGLIP